MIKTHKKSSIYRIAEKELKDIDEVVIQLEHISEPIAGNFHCFVEVVKKQDFDTEGEFERTKKALNELRDIHERLCSAILAAFGVGEDAETIEIKELGHLRDALEIAGDWYC